jgi:hypothetical protein
MKKLKAIWNRILDFMILVPDADRLHLRAEILAMANDDFINSIKKALE